MKGTNLGELEEIVLLAIGSIKVEAHCEKICNDINKRANRKLTIGMLHTVLTRLSQKEFVTSELGESSSYRGGKRKRYYKLSKLGKITLVKTKELRDMYWALL